MPKWRHLSYRKGKQIVTFPHYSWDCPVKLKGRHKELQMLECWWVPTSVRTEVQGYQCRRGMTLKVILNHDCMKTHCNRANMDKETIHWLPSTASPSLIKKNYWKSTWHHHPLIHLKTLPQNLIFKLVAPPLIKRSYVKGKGHLAGRMLLKVWRVQS